MQSSEPKTKFFRHYKNKPYKYLGTVKHSESLEDLVLYECLYENQNAKIWVRPKEMFFENVKLDGKSVPRFAPIPVKIESFTEIHEVQLKLIAPLIEKTLMPWNSEWLQSRLLRRQRLHLAIASVDSQPVGFKLGYEYDQANFYSWLGGVLPEFRGLGVASSLMQLQHEWCRQQGYRRIETKTQNRYKDMLILNLKFGFEIIGTHANDDEGGTRIMLAKKL